MKISLKMSLIQKFVLIEFVLFCAIIISEYILEPVYSSLFLGDEISQRISNIEESLSILTDFGDFISGIIFGLMVISLVLYFISLLLLFRMKIIGKFLYLYWICFIFLLSLFPFNYLITKPISSVLETSYWMVSGILLYLLLISEEARKLK